MIHRSDSVYAGQASDMIGLQWDTRRGGENSSQAIYDKNSKHDGDKNEEGDIQGYGRRDVPSLHLANVDLVSVVGAS